MRDLPEQSQSQSQIGVECYQKSSGLGPRSLDWRPGTYTSKLSRTSPSQRRVVFFPGILLAGLQNKVMTAGRMLKKTRGSF
ncbi:hypothetical protein RRG08_009511 [Elysia crispata]|uniref:Uncharacterized protein n=1 Tax=Elysia crispata TaxID=231223 RepID=A0AAE1B1N6_9GAST|nr:hypothetical protein RRG08_009511 [Elysia crispata]